MTAVQPPHVDAPVPTMLPLKQTATVIEASSLFDTISSAARPLDSIEKIVKQSAAPALQSKLALNTEGTATVPLIDLEAIEMAEGDVRRQLIEHFGNSLIDFGFIAIKAEEFTSIIQQVNRQMALYFHQPLEMKMKDWRDNNGQAGFSPMGRETAAGAKHADIKETYFIPSNNTIWPESPEGFQEVMQEYHTKLSLCAARLMIFVAEYLNEPAEDIAVSIASDNNKLRLSYYPAPQPTDHAGAIWAQAHKDLNAITLLPRSTVPGLELLKNGEWIPVMVPEGYMIVNLGEQVERWTAGKLKATLHRVKNPGGDFADRERFSSIYFASWSKDFSLKPLDKCLEEMTRGMNEEEKQQYLKNYPAITVEENLLSRLIELGTIKTPSKELVSRLRGLGVLRQPPEAVVAMYPDLFGE